MTDNSANHQRQGLHDPVRRNEEATMSCEECDWEVVEPFGIAKEMARLHAEEKDHWDFTAEVVRTEAVTEIEGPIEIGEDYRGEGLRGGDQ